MEVIFFIIIGMAVCVVLEEVGVVLCVLFIFFMYIDDDEDEKPVPVPVPVVAPVAPTVDPVCEIGEILVPNAAGERVCVLGGNDY